ncbi:type 4b pilus protein PilO2 [Pusillimonas sp. DMV24BSW_D]|uniref:type 4b pilus protein PilO2 n=1 Tax=Neopusillimonas aestuarii TaxID=2716226 RepID=UPI00140A93EA|nr:type 4b pilus protein PilO2 [Pusillimonas sp. DMV24BSW_D]QIM49908.1 type 4b pilus protein PilO2 [Pusillimonas sp. DMV24BSW_D]
MKESLLKSVAGKTLAFGLEWLPLIESLGRREARRRAGRYRASHFVLASDKTAAVGLANISRRKASGMNREVVFSAAQNVATLYQSGTWVVCLNLAPDCWWLVAVHEGVVVIRTDILASDPESFDAVVVELRRAYPRMAYLQSGRDKDAPSLGLLAQHAGQASMLQARRRTWVGVSVWISVTIVALVVGLVIFASFSATESAADSEILAATTQSHERRWRAAQEAALDRVFVHGVQGTQRLLEALYGVAVTPSGWRLKQVECLPARQLWHCVAQFLRRHPATDVQALESALPASWTLEPRDLDRVSAIWSVPYLELTLAQMHIATAAESRKTWLGILQRSSIAFDRIIWGEAKPFAIAAPIDPQGNVLPRPDGLTTYQSRSLQLSGPLRSYVLLLADLNAIRWSRARLSLKDKIVPGARASQLHLLLEGEFHERVE